MTEQPLDLWQERRGELTVLVGQLRPEDALEVLQHVIADCEDERTLAPILIGILRGIVERRAAAQEQNAGSDRARGRMENEGGPIHD